MAKKKPHKYTKQLQFSKAEQEKIWIRDNGCCIFCTMGFHRKEKYAFALEIKDVMHFIPKSSLGLGIEQNGAIGCRYHHMLLDNGNKGLREEMLKLFEEYLKSKYQDWDREKLVYRKYNF